MGEGRVRVGSKDRQSRGRGVEGEKEQKNIFLRRLKKQTEDEAVCTENRLQGERAAPPQRGGGRLELRLTYTWSQSHVEGVDAGQSKVGDLDLPAAADQNVVGLQVAVHHHVCVQEVQPPQQLLHHVLRPGQKG